MSPSVASGKAGASRGGGASQLSPAIAELQRQIDHVHHRIHAAGAQEEYAEALALQSLLPPLRQQLQAELTEEIVRAEAAVGEERRVPRETPVQREVVERTERKPKLSHAKHLASSTPR